MLVEEWTVQLVAPSDARARDLRAARLLIGSSLQQWQVQVASDALLSSRPGWSLTVAP